MMLVLGGTADARDVAGALVLAGHRVTLTTVTAYAGQLAEAFDVRVGALDAATLGALAREAEAVIDATHPFATEISRLAIAACAECGTPYLRFERPDSALPPHVTVAESADDAARRAVALAEGGLIFLTVGSKSLASYLPVIRAANCPLVARVLPTASVLAACEALGLAPRELIAMQGPTSAALDAALLRHLDARVLVTKESGATGGVEEKISAAEAVGIPAVVVRRPAMAYPRVVRSVGELMEVMDGKA